MISTGQSPRALSPRRVTSGADVSEKKSTTRNTRGSSVSSMASARAVAVEPPRTASDVFEIVADGNAEMLRHMIEFSGAQHLCELRSKKQEDYGRNLLHCAVTNGQIRTLHVLLKHRVFDPNQV